MLLALRQARRAEGSTFPNPPVGAVVYRADRVLGSGYTKPAGGPHAEIVALEGARRRHGPASLRGASMAVTLEPCCHQGRTPPCTTAVAEAGISQVAVGHRDPSREVDGRGLRRLRARGIRVEVGVLEEACRYQHRGFLSCLEQGRPWVALKLAASLDGRIATSRGESRWITGERSRARVHALRARADAIVVGSGTLRMDDPELAARRKGRLVRRPIRIVVDSRLAVPAGRRLLRGDDASSTWVLAAPGAPAKRRLRLEARGVRVLSIPRRGGHLDLARGLSRLGQEGLTSLFVEGGGGLAAALLRRGLVDELHWFAAPALIGGDGRPAVAALNLPRLSSRIRFETRSVKRLGEDLYLHGLVAWRREGSA
jgi:diaminohydroxyphosphoribosylaminopyrimidine deaminase/5-amino-6-(5-phosphoribosylamino)uracil reductase